MGYVYRKAGRRIYMMKYYRHGIPIWESSETDNERKAKKKCRARETDIARGLPISADLGKLTIEAAAADILADYADNDHRSRDAVERHLRLHLLPAFRGWKMAQITTPDVRQYTQLRRARACSACPWIAHAAVEADLLACPVCSAPTVPGAAAGQINRELATLKRMFTLAVQGGKLLYKPYIPLLVERNTRKGFFEPAQFQSVRAQLPAELQPVVTFAYVTGWRIDSEVLPLEWGQVALDAGEVRIEPDEAKNREARTFPLTPELQALLTTLRAAHDARARAGVIAPWVFVRVSATKRGGAAAASPRRVKRIKRFDKAWRAACRAAGAPGKLPHDFRRTAIRNMVRRGVPERVAMTLAGHKTRSVFERYNIVSPGDLAEARTKLAGLGAEKGTPTGTPRAIQAVAGKNRAK